MGFEDGFIHIVEGQLFAPFNSLVDSSLAPLKSYLRHLPSGHDSPTNMANLAMIFHGYVAGCCQNQRFVVRKVAGPVS